MAIPEEKQIGLGALLAGALFAALALVGGPGSAVAAEAEDARKKIGVGRGICVVLGLPKATQAGFVTDLAKNGELLVYFQSPDPAEVAAVRRAAEAAGLLGGRVFVDRGDWRSVHLADNLAGAVRVGAAAQGKMARQELLRVLHPGGKAILGEEEIIKPFPKGIDGWSHPYHGPDNNPQSNDQVARAPYLTQFLAEPAFCPQPTVTVGAGGRLFKAFGHCATHANQNEWLNTLLCVNAYNGTLLWRRALREGFTIYRNTMIATPEVLYLADDQSCKRIDARSGQVRSRIAIPAEISDGPMWKWMALEDGVLYGLVGGAEVSVPPRPSKAPGYGGWPVPTQEETYRNYRSPGKAPGFGRTLVAVHPGTGKIRWSHREKEHIDSRGVCMKNGRIYFYSPQKFLGCLDARTGKVLWKTSEAAFLKAMGPLLHGRLGGGRIFFAETSYVKCTDRFVFFAGYQRPNLVAVSAKDGGLLWTKPLPGVHLVLRPDALYAVRWGVGLKLAYETGKEQGRFLGLLACARPVGSADSLFFRTLGGTARLDVASGAIQHIAPMRPPCIDGVVISDGHVYWGPWMCACPLSMYGHICLAPAGKFNRRPGVDRSRLETGPGEARSAGKAAAGLVFQGDPSGAVRAVNAADRKLRWKAYTGGSIFFPPCVWQGRVYVGSADGWVYAFEAGTGKRLWRFRVAPVQRWIPVYGNLISTWPVAGGVVVQDGVVYAAAGIAHYDGTHVVALDAVTGKVKWYNDSSGEISAKVKNGISLQGKLYLEGGELRFGGGNVYGVARYALQTGKCLNPPSDTTRAGHRTFFRPYYGKYLRPAKRAGDRR